MAEEGYGKRPIWQWVVIYLVVGLVIYGAIYYFVIAKKGGYSYNSTVPASSAPVAKNSVQISSFSFSPASLTVKVGDTVTWTNQDSVGHSATADDKSFETGILGQGKSGAITFSKAGTYAYYCSVHSSMRGTVIVKI